MNKYQKIRNIFIALILLSILFWPTKYHVEPYPGCIRNPQIQCSWQYKVKIPIFSNEFWTWHKRVTRFPEEKSYNIYKEVAIYSFGLLVVCFHYKYKKQENRK